MLNANYVMPPLQQLHHNRRRCQQRIIGHGHSRHARHWAGQGGTGLLICRVLLLLMVFLLHTDCVRGYSMLAAHMAEVEDGQAKGAAAARAHKH
jgi:hypothetical protein